MKGDRHVSVYILDSFHYGGSRALLFPFRSYNEERLGNGAVSASVYVYRQLSSVLCSAVWLFCGFVCAGIFQLDIIRSV